MVHCCNNFVLQNASSLTSYSSTWAYYHIQQSIAFVLSTVLGCSRNCGSSLYPGLQSSSWLTGLKMNQYRSFQKYFCKGNVLCFLKQNCFYFKGLLCITSCFLPYNIISTIWFCWVSCLQHNNQRLYITVYIVRAKNRDKLHKVCIPELLIRII